MMCERAWIVAAAGTDRASRGSRSRGAPTARWYGICIRALDGNPSADRATHAAASHDDLDSDFDPDTRHERASAQTRSGGVGPRRRPLSTSRHRMPFGAELDDGAVRFRLWAPAAERVAVEISNGDAEPHLLDLTPAGNGWFELTTEAAGPGSRYCYRVTGAQSDGRLPLPDPASRFQPEGVHGPSEVIDPTAFCWHQTGPGSDWRGMPWQTAVIYELHVGCFSREGSFAGAARRLQQLADLGVTAVELMPVAAFPGRRNWGYDGVLPFAPAASYGRPEDLKAFVEQAHALGLMVLLDVVYNHFGPEGNYLHLYAPQFFTDRHQTPWGDGINFDGDGSPTVRDFFIQNALYWIEEYRLDGLRLDAVHAIADDSPTHILTDLARAVEAGPGQQRRVHLVLENDANEAHRLKGDARSPGRYAAQWNDDFHHAAHVLLTGERDGYYADYAEAPARSLGRCLAEGFAYQGEASGFRHGEPRGEPSRLLPPTAFVNLLQNHDQVGNRAFGERLHQLTRPEAVRAATAVLLLAPSPPLLFMGQEVAADSPFLFFCDFGPDLAEAVTAGRRREFSRFLRFADEAAQQAIPDPNAPATFARSRLDWSDLDQPEHRAWRSFHRRLLALRRTEIVPRLVGMGGASGTAVVIGETGLSVRWQLGDGATLQLFANLGERELADAALATPLAALAPTDRLHMEPATAESALAAGRLPPWGVAWYLTPAASAASAASAATPEPEHAG
jgi:maltooligosyltrehalose trehalohydrolase